MPSTAPFTAFAVGAAVAVMLALSACAGPETGTPTSPSSTAPTAVASPTGGSSPEPTDPTPSPSAPPSAAPGPTTLVLGLEPFAAGFDGPLDLAVRPGDPDALYVVEQAGRIRSLRGGAVVADPVLDISDAVTIGGEQGLLGMAFHPNPADGRFFLYYTDSESRQVVSSFEMDPDDPDRALAASERILLQMDDQYSNHNGGALAFGPDGYLYIGTGDGGGGGDPLDSGRRLDTLLAKVLRIDVDADGADGEPYAIPPGNPFIDDAGARPEIWHTGLRNPWRIRFDRATGDLWIGDVGQSAWEEIDRAPAGVGGLDFGWNEMEGTYCFGSTGGRDCSSPDFTLPVAEYGHDEGCSVTGGAVYRGAAQPALVGRYVFADYCSGRFWTIDAAAAADTIQVPTVALDSGRNISAIAEDGSGELFATDLAAGEVLRIVVTPG